MYIPAPPEDIQKLEKEKETDGNGPLTTPAPAHLYPPKPPQPAPTTGKRRFRFRFLRSKKKDGLPGGSNDGRGERTAPLTWEDHWEQSEYPFVRLEGNRAACAICLLDFEEPKRLFGGAGVGDAANDTSVKGEESGASGVSETGGIHEIPTLVSSSPSTAENTSGTPAEELRLEDAGEGAQPLRLLACGHVFHVGACLYPTILRF